MRNHGDSDHHDSMSYREMAEDVVRYVQQRNISRVTVLGHSMGGKIAMALATLHPDKIDGLIVVDAPPKNAKRDVGYVSESVAIVLGLLKSVAR